MNNDLTEYGTRYVDLIGLSGTITDLEKREETWALIKIDIGDGWEGSFLVNFESQTPTWLNIGEKIEITENGIKLVESQSKRCRQKAKDYLSA